MTNLLTFPSGGARDIRAEILLDPQPHSHAVQFYESDEYLFETVAQFLGAGLRGGDALLVIATKDHRDGFIRHLQSFDVDKAVSQGQLVLLDARETLGRFMAGDAPDPDLFRHVVGGLIANAKDVRPGGRVRAYGEMVDLLWRDGNPRGAIRLEELWNEAGKAHEFSLLCAYVMGNFYREGDAAQFMDVCRTHSHVVPTESFTAIDDPLARLREISLLQQRARSLENEIQHRKDLEQALRDALRERSRIEDELRSCVQREKEMRERAEASDSFKEMFLSILGHDLRNPLNTVLTTARLMKTRGQQPTGESERRVERIVASGVRMEKMIAQLLDVARARLAGGIPVKRAAQDLVPLAMKIVEETRAANPGREIIVQAEAGSCAAFVDGDRFEQVLSNLLGNAVTHGDAERPIAVGIAPQRGMATAFVHNFGQPIEASLLPALFDPFKRGAHTEGAHEGLGLGLYIVDRIVHAHGGTVTVESAIETGTRFVASFPLATHA